MAGRKSIKDEIKIVERLSALTEPTFKYIQEMFNSGEKTDKKWATEQMMKLYSKCIPQTIEGDSDNPITLQITGMKIVKDGDRVQDKKSETAPSGPVLDR